MTTETTQFLMEELPTLANSLLGDHDDQKVAANLVESKTLSPSRFLTNTPFQ
jgi:hypothetical protein